MSKGFNLNIQITAFLPPEVLPTEQYSCTMYMYFSMAFITYHFLTGHGILLATASGGRGCGGVGVWGLWGRSNLPQKSSTVFSETKFEPTAPTPNQKIPESPPVIHCIRVPSFKL